jgi:hypothetical protein
VRIGQQYHSRVSGQKKEKGMRQQNYSIHDDISNRMFFLLINEYTNQIITEKLTKQVDMFTFFSLNIGATLFILFLAFFIKKTAFSQDLREIMFIDLIMQSAFLGAYFLSAAAYGKMAAFMFVYQKIMYLIVLARVLWPFKSKFRDEYFNWPVFSPVALIRKISGYESRVCPPTFWQMIGGYITIAGCAAMGYYAYINHIKNPYIFKRACIVAALIFTAKCAPGTTKKYWEKYTERRAREKTAKAAAAKSATQAIQARLAAEDAAREQAERAVRLEGEKNAAEARAQGDALAREAAEARAHDDALARAAAEARAQEEALARAATEARAKRAAKLMAQRSLQIQGETGFAQAREITAKQEVRAVRLRARMLKQTLLARKRQAALEPKPTPESKIINAALNPNTPVYTPGLAAVAKLLLVLQEESNNQPATTKRRQTRKEISYRYERILYDQALELGLTNQYKMPNEILIQSVIHVATCKVVRFTSDPPEST